MLAGQLAFAFALGGSAVFAPCAYPLLPGYLAYFLGRTEGATSPTGTAVRAAGVGLTVSAGFWLVYAALGAVVFAVGTAALGDLVLVEPVVGLLLVGVGTAMALGRGPSVRVALPERRRSLLGFLLFGVVYAVAAAGCTALLSFSVVAGALASGPVAGLWTLLAYVAGMSAVMVGLSVAAGLGREALLRRLSARVGRVERVAGVLLVLAGLAQVALFLFVYDGLAVLGL